MKDKWYRLKRHIEILMIRYDAEFALALMLTIGILVGISTSLATH